VRIFLSHYAPEGAVALALKSAIEQAIPGADVCVDQTQPRAGHLWQPALFDAIANSQAFLILVSNRLGDRQKVEYYEARDRQAKDDAFTLLPIVVADRAKGPAANLPGLAQLHWIESTEPTAPEPLAKIVAALQSRELPKVSEPWRVISPYRGLAALDEQDADFFFGRERETSDLLGHMIAKSGRLIALVGNCGVGKSSLIQAGVIGSLKRQRWPRGRQTWPDALKDSRAWAYLTMRPGEDPIAALISAFASLWYPDATDPRRIEWRDAWIKRLREGKGRIADLIEATDKQFHDTLSLSPPPRVFLHIDQGEELCARTPAPARKRFSELIGDGLGSCPQRLIVMTSQRADYYGELQNNNPLFRRTEKIDVEPLDGDALTLVLREPAGVLGVKFESDELIGHAVKSAEDQPGALPLLADLFTDLWERMRERGDGVLRVLDRREVIQLGAALSKRADKFLAMHPGKEEAVKRLFTLRLAHVPRQGKPVLTRWEGGVKRASQQFGDAEWALAEELAGPEWRLLVLGEKDGKATAEVAHEILVKSWKKLKSWFGREREFLVWRDEIAARREDWERAGDGGVLGQRQALLKGMPLDTAENWLRERHSDIEPALVTFIEASGRESRKAARSWAWMRRALGVLMLAVIGGLLAYINQNFFTAQYQWRLVMRPASVLTAEQEKEMAARPGAEFRECAVGCPVMIVVPAGKFTMGSPEDEKGRSEWEGPQHEVTIARPFAVGRTDVTFAEWDICVAAAACPKTSDNGWGRGDRPVILVSWEEAKGYVRWLTRMTGKVYRLLSESEWEYAARAGNQSRYTFGDDETKLGDHAWYVENSEAKTQPVGMKRPNAFGLYDVHGNVWQLVEDCYHYNYREAPSDGSAWTGQCGNRVLRGGSWIVDRQGLRSAVRLWTNPYGRYTIFGFRVARTLTP
jgi:formylglycine-generating enzyme required for sulfatase activity